MIEIQSLRKSFGSRAVLEGVTLAARNGAVTGLLGPNGAGKTTTLRCLGGLLAADSGALRISGAPPGDNARRALGLLPENAGLSPRLTGRENIAYAGRLHGLSGGALGKAVDRAIDALGLDSIADRPGQSFSQGERRRVAIARALVHDPENVVLDEPTNSLDVMSVRHLRDLVRRLARSGKAVLFSTHVLHDAALLCDEVVVMAEGRVLRQEQPQRLLAESGAATLEEAFLRTIGTEEGLR